MKCTVTVSGFKTYTHTNLTIAAAQTLKEDIPSASRRDHRVHNRRGPSFAAPE